MSTQNREKPPSDAPQATGGPVVSVVMSVYNGETHLRESIESILHQDYEKLEFIIVDDASTDDSLSIMEGYAGTDERVRVLSNEENLGLAASLNKGIEAAHGKYIARHDADDVALPWRLQVQVDFLESNPRFFLVGGWAYNVDEAGNRTGFRKRPTGEKRVREALIEEGVNPFIHPSLMFRAGHNVFYRPKFEYSQDYDFLLRALDAGLKLFNLPQVLLEYRAGEKTRSGGKAVQQRAYRRIAL